MITLKNIYKSYNGKVVLDDINVTIRKGSCFGLVGPNGAGKSTLVKIITSIIRSDKGFLYINGAEKGKKDLYNIGYVPQHICLEEKLTAIQNLRYFGKLYGLHGKELHAQVEKVLEQIGLTVYGNEKVNTFSGGMKRRLNIGCAFMHKPTIIIMDEPTVGIDAQSRNYIFEMIERLKQQGTTIIYVSHYMEEVEQLCDEIALMDHGKVIEAGTISMFLNKYSQPSVFVKRKPNHVIDLPTVTNVHLKKDGYVYKTASPLQVMQEIIEDSIKNDYHVEQLEIMRPKLEEVFFHLTGSQLRE